jgi:hypothetical protein
MARFTTDNTDGFTTAELATLNAAFSDVMTIQRDHPDADDNNDAVWAMIGNSLADNINDAWQPGMDKAALVAALDRSWFA